ncbi:MAG: LysM peptidoglycan-binding domain-containing protein [Bacteroidetes bacterium]|nr:LysM peptidoglycan-binding domain-containing protein [Bacteroidales bacterium]MBU1008686.1 LysM peptidoglycan-binding domain-containing protein [Bacteroidota bacterium]
MKFKIFLLQSVILFFSITAYAQSEVEEVLPDSTFLEEDSLNAAEPDTSLFSLQSGLISTDDSPIVKMLDSLYRIRYFDNNQWISDSSNWNKYGYDPAFVPGFSDSVYASRIAALKLETPINLVYNQHVKSFIELYAIRKRGLTSRILGLSYVYFPMFEEMLDKYDIPLELKYLAVIESALNPTAGSRAGAKGMWQFMYGTGKVYNLKVTSLVDDRFDPYKSTVAACEHLSDLYDIYQDWFLVLAAYNSGAGNVNRAIRRAGGVKDYWAIWPYLPRETRGYVPAFIAVNYVMNYPTEHNLYPFHPGIMMSGTDTVTVNDLLSFDQLNEMLGIPMEDLRFFNPQFKKDIIPASPENPYVIRIPSDFIGPFLNNETAIYAFKTQKGVEKAKLAEEVKKVSDRSIHVVKRGENLGLIARKYRVSVSQLMAWNGMKKNLIHPGQNLVVFSSGSPATVSGETPVKRSNTSKYHTVKNGETLGKIATDYSCSVTDLREWNNLSGTMIHVGQKLRVYPVESNSTAQKGEVNGKYIYHTVRSGDTLWDIARQYDGVTVEQIKRLNNLSNKSKIMPGQKLKIASVG